MNHSLEIKMEVFDDENDVSIQVRQFPDYPEKFIEIHTSHNNFSEEHYGKQSIVLNHEQVDLLIEALSRVKKHQLEQNDKKTM